MNEVKTIERDRVNALELEMRKMPQLELLTQHYFSPGLYTRALHIPKGCLLTGAIHKYPILNIMMTGDISVLIGEEVKRIKAPFVIVTPAGSKKIGYAHEYTIWMGVMRTDETDIAKIEDHFVAKSDEKYIEFIKLLGVENRCS